MNTRRIILLTGAVVSLVGVGAYVWFAACASDVELHDKIVKAMAKGDGAPVYLDEVADFEWDTLHVFGPYTSTDAMNEALGFEWTCGTRVELRDTDFYSLLVFSRDDEVVRFVRLNRGRGDFAPFSMKAYPRAEARFAAVRSLTGRIGVRHVVGDGATPANSHRSRSSSD